MITWGQIILLSFVVVLSALGIIIAILDAADDIIKSIEKYLNRRD